MSRQSRDIRSSDAKITAGIFAGRRGLIAVAGVVAATACVGGALARAADDKWNATVATTSGAEVADQVAVPSFPRAAQVTAQSTKAKAPAAAPASRLAQRRTRTKEGEPVGPAYPTVDTVPKRAAVPDVSPGMSPDPAVRFSAPSLMIMQHGPLPEGQWSTIVTGALGAGDAAKKALARNRQQFVEQDPEAATQAAPAAHSEDPASPLAPKPLPADAASPATVAPADQGAAKPEDAAKAATAEPNEPAAPKPAEAAKPAAARTFSPPPPAPHAAAPAAPVPEAKGAAGQPPAQPSGAEAKPGATAVAPVAKQPAKPLESLPPNATQAEQYCFNTIDTAQDARFAWQAKKITEMEGELAKRVSLLELKTEEFKTWLARRDDFSKKAQEKLVGVYTRMRPDAAALQLAAMDEETAAAVLMKLDTKVASAVLGEMDTARAARLAAIISGAGKLPAERAKAAATQPGAAPASAAKPKAEGSASAPAAGAKS